MQRATGRPQPHHPCSQEESHLTYPLPPQCPPLTTPSHKQVAQWTLSLEVSPLEHRVGEKGGEPIRDLTYPILQSSPAAPLATSFHEDRQGPGASCGPSPTGLLPTAALAQSSPAFQVLTTSGTRLCPTASWLSCDMSGTSSCPTTASSHGRRPSVMETLPDLGLCPHG